MISAHLTIDPHFVVGPINRRLFGSFVEHLGRCVYDGIYEPGHPDADEDGFRRDVIALVKELGVTTIRYPGRQLRLGLPLGGRRRAARATARGASTSPGTPRRRTRSVSTSSRLAAKVGSELMYAVNLGTRGVQEALDVLEYANIRVGHRAVRPADRERRRRAVRHPDVVPRQRDGRPVAARTRHPRENTGASRSKTARAMRQIDPDARARRRAAARAPRCRLFGELGADRARGDLRRGRLHLLPRLLRADRRRLRELPRVRGQHGPLHRLRRRDRRPRQGRCAAATRRSTSRSTSGTSGTSRATPRSTGSPSVDDWPVAPRLLEDVYSVVDSNTWRCWPGLVVLLATVPGRS